MNPIGAQLAKDHEELNELLVRLSQDAAAPSFTELQAIWSQLEGRLMGHLDAEEHYLLPLVEAGHPAETERTRAEHLRIRRMVTELGVAVELHAARQPVIDELIRMLREHAEWEDKTLYRWASDSASTSVQQSVSSKLKSAARSALAAVTKLTARASNATG